MPYVPLRWLGEHVELPAGATAEEVAADLVRVGLEEEAIHGPQVTGPLVVGRVLSATPETQRNGRTIRWCQVDVGEASPRGIVCGAENVVAGAHVVVALPGAVLPGPFPITARKTYGHLSDGMIASPRELGLGDDHTGILVLSDEQVAGTGPGDDAVALLGLDESVVELNVTPDRGYCFSVRGVAREYGHATGAAFTDRGLPRPGERLVGPDGAGFPVEVDDAAPIHGRAGCDRFVARIVRGVDASTPSPAWLQRRLSQAGMRPISLAVDVTNYVMLDLGQPLHAYDLATLVAPVVVRRARPGERLVTLDGVDRPLDVEDLLITDSAGGRAARPLGLAGVMGGAETEVTASTSDVLVEAAHFHDVTVARTARRHRLPSEAAKRFERGVDPALPALAAQRVVELLVEYGGGIADEHVTDVDRTAAPSPVVMRASLPTELVGVPYPTREVRDALVRIGCEVRQDAGAAAGDPVLTVTPPTWRPDLTGPADLVEEVARLQGYDRIGSVLPTATVAEGLTADQRRRRSVSRALAAAGFVEVLSYPFVGGVHDAFALAPDDPRRRVVTLVNPLSATEPGLRTSVLDTLVEAARRNVGRGLTDLALFEVGLVTVAPEPEATSGPGASPVPAEFPPVGVRPDDATLAAIHRGVPAQPWHVAGILTGRREPAGVWGPGRPATWADAVEAVHVVARAVRVELAAAAAERPPWHPGRCAELRTADGAVVGHAGELHPAVTAALDLPARSAAFELDLDALLAASPKDAIGARPVSVFPAAKEDVALVVDADVPVGAVLAAVREGAGDLAEQVRLFDVFTGEQVGPGKKSVAVALRLRAADRTLTAEETAAVRDRVVAAAARRVGGELRG